MKKSSGITIQVDGEPTDLADVTWLVVAPCGCASGCTVAYLPPPYDLVKVTADQAAADYYGTKANREQAERRGFKIIPIHRERLTEFMNHKCPHIPQWGYERPTPDEMTWAASRWGRGRVLHLVAAEAVDAESGSPRARPLCKGAEAGGWSYKFSGDQPDCEKCIKVALEQGVLL